MKRWKKISLALLAAAVAALIWASQSGWLLGAARQGLEDGLRQATGRDVHVGKLTGGFNGWVWLHDLSLGAAPDGRRPDVSVTAEALGLKLDWVELVLHRRARLQDLQALRLVGAEAYVLLPKAGPPSTELTPTSQAQDPLRGLRLALANAPLPPVRASLEGGRIWGQRGGQAPQLWLDHAELAVLPAAGRLGVKGSGVSLGGAQLALEAEADDSMKRAKAQLKFKQLALASFPWPAGLSANAGTLEGSLKLQAEPGLPGPWPGLSLEGAGRLAAAGLRWHERPVLEAGQARWTLHEQRLSVDSAQADLAGGRWKGEGSLDFSDAQAPRLKARAGTSALDLAALAQLAGAPAGLSLTGKASAEFEAAGPLSATALSLGLRSAQAAWRGQALSDLEIDWDQDAAASQNVMARMAWEQGQARFDGVLDPAGNHHGSFKAEGVRGDWLASVLGGSLQGKLQAEGHWQGGPQGLTWDAKAKSPYLQLGSLDLKDLDLQGWGDSKALHARLEGDALGWKGLNADVDAKRAADGAWLLKGSKLYIGNRLLAQAEGHASQAGDRSWTGEWKLKAGPWPVSDLPVLRDFSGLSGTVQAQGALQLAAGNFLWQATVDAPDLSRFHVPAGLHARADGGAKAISVTALTLRKGEVAGELHWFAPGNIGVDLALQQADLQALGALVGASVGVSGSATGPLKIQRPSAARFWMGQADWDLAGLQVGGLRAEKASLHGNVDGSHWHLQRLSAEQAGGGRWNAQGDADLSGREPWSGHSDWKDWKVGPAQWDAKAELSGGAGGAAMVHFSGLKLSGTAQPDLKAELHFSEQKIQAWTLAWGSELVLKGQRGTGGWDAQAELLQLDPMRVWSLAQGSKAYSGLSLSGSLHLKGIGGEEPGGSMDVFGAGQGHLKGAWTQATAKKPLLGHLEWTSVDLDDLQRAWSKAGLGPELDWRGRSSGQVQAGPGGLTFSAELESFDLLGMPFGPGSLSGSWSSAAGLKLNDLSLGGSEARLSLKKAAWSRGKDAWSAEGELEASDLPYSLFTLGGKGRLKATGKGGEGRLSSDWAWLQTGTRRHDALALELTWKDGAWTLGPKDKKAFHATGKLRDGDFILSSVDSRLGLKATAQLKGEVLRDGSLSFDGQANGYPAGELTGILGWPQEWKGVTYGTLSVRGTTTSARTVVSAKIENGSVGGLAFDLAQATVHVEDGWVKLGPLGPIKVSRQKAYAMEIDGQIPLDGADGRQVGDMDVRAKLKDGGLGFFASLPGISAANGPLDLDLRFSGQRGDPTLNGTLKVSNGSITPNWMLPPLEKVELFVQILDGQVQLQQAQARVVNDGPLIRLELADKGRPAFVMERWEPERFNLRLRTSASGIPVRSTKQLRFLDGTLHPDLLLSGGWQDPAVSGTVTLEHGALDKALVTWPPQFDPPLAKTDPDADPGFLDKLEWDLVLNARQDVLLRSQVAQIFVDTGENGLRLRGAAPHRSLEGRLKAIKGNVDYLFTSFDLATDKPSWVDFLGEDDPQLELQGVKQVRDALLNGQTVRRNVEVRLHAFGPLGQVSMRLDSDDSTLTQDQLASLAGFGVDTSDSRNQGGFARLLGKAPAAVLTRYARSTGVFDEVGVRLPAVEDALAGGPKSLTTGPGAEEGADVSPTSKPLVDVSVGKWLSEKWFVGGNTQVNEHKDAKGASTMAPAFGGKVEYQLKNDARLSAQQNVDNAGGSEQRVMLERASSFDNYNPRKRRWGSPDIEPTPQRAATPTVTMTPAGAP